MPTGMYYIPEFYLLLGFLPERCHTKNSSGIHDAFIRTKCDDHSTEVW